MHCALETIAGDYHGVRNKQSTLEAQKDHHNYDRCPMGVIFILALIKQ